MSTKLTAAELHDAVVKYLATERFSPPDGQFYPGGFSPSWRTYANSPVHQMPVPPSDPRRHPSRRRGCGQRTWESSDGYDRGRN